MRFIGHASLGLVLVAAAACTYGFPNAKDGSRLYKCAAAKDCTSGFACIDQVCLDTQKFGTETITVKGRVQLPASTVYTNVKDVELGAAVAADGSYALQVPVGDGHDVVAIYSRGPATQPQVELASVLGEVDRLKQLADTGAVTEADLPAVVLTPFTTAEYGALVAANAGTLPATLDDLVEAEQNLTYAFTGDQLLDAAAAIFELSKAGSTTVQSTLALASDATAMRAFVAQARALASPPSDAITTAAASLIADPDMTAAFRAASLPPSYFSAVKHRHGFIGFADERVVMGNAGKYHVQVYSGSLPPSLNGVGWSFDPDGGLTATLTPALLDSIEMSAFDLASYFADATTRTSVINAVGSDLVYVPLTVDTMHVHLLASGTAADWVVVTKHGTLGLADTLSLYGITATDQVTTAPPASRLWIRSDSVGFLPWPSLPNTTWPMQLMLPSDLGFAGDLPGTTVVTTAFVTFASTGMATATGGVIPAGQGITLRWTKSADGVLTLTYPDGVHTQRMALWDTLPPVYGMLTWHNPDPATEYMSYGPTLIQDVATATESAMVNADGEYWVSEMNGAWYPPEAGDSVPREWWFGFELHPDHSVIRRTMSQSIPGGPYQWFLETYFWRIEGNDVVLEEHRSASGRWSTCTIPGTDPSCFVYRWRRWQPVSMSAARDRLYLLERDARYYGPQIVWNGSQWVTASGGTAVDVTTLSYQILPRFNIYYRSPIGQ